MATLNLSTNGPSITKSYQSLISSPVPSGPASASPTYGQWAVFSVTAPLANAFQQDSGKESVLKVQSTGEGELADLVDEFSDGRIQFAFVKVKDPNTGLPKNALVGWCGEGVPERTKGYFSNHQAAVSKVLHGYHVQISARSDRDLTPQGIIQKISDASGAKYSGSSKQMTSSPAPGPPPKKPVFTATRSGSGPSSFNPLVSRRTATSVTDNVDEDGWGQDAPPVTRTQLEKVESSYKPVKVDIGQLRGQKQEHPLSEVLEDQAAKAKSDVVKGGYQPVGKVDIAAIRRQAAESGQLKEERPAPIRGAYEPVGKIDIADIRAKAQPPIHKTSTSKAISTISGGTLDPTDQKRDLAPTASDAFQTSERLSELPKPKIGNRLGLGSGSFAGTKAPVPTQLGTQSSGPQEKSYPMGPGRTFASSAVKTPAQIWAEKKAAQGETITPALQTTSEPVTSHNSGGWKSGYEGKKWATVQTTKNTAPAADTESMEDVSEEAIEPPREMGAIRDQFAQASLSDQPNPIISTKPTVSEDGTVSGAAIHKETDREAQNTLTFSPTSASPLSEKVTEEPVSPVRIAVPVARGGDTMLQEAHIEQKTSNLHLDSREDQSAHIRLLGDGPGARPNSDPIASTIEENLVANIEPVKSNGDKRAIAQYDYEKAEDNELELKEGEFITNIEMVDTDWWMGQNSTGEVGLFPSNYVELVENEPTAVSHGDSAPSVQVQVGGGRTAIAQYDYEAAEDNELSFPEGAKITNVEFPDDDWWSGEYKGMQGLFPANYVELS